MLLVRIWNFIKGFVKINVKGIFIERFLNICMNRNIYMWDVRNKSANSIDMKISIDGFRRIRPVAKKSRSKVTILEKKGLPFIIYRNKKRKAFFIGAVVAIIFISYMTSFIWVIDIVGNEKVEDEVILSALEKNGFKIGTKGKNTDVVSLQNRMLLDVGELSWLWVDIKGTKAVVEVKEKVPAPQIVDKSIPCNIIANKGGLITQVLVTNGLKMVNVGDVVKEGDLLASGIVDTAYEGVKYLHSTASIMARTWYDVEMEVPLIKTNNIKTGEKITKNTINLFGFDIKLFLDKNEPYKTSEKETKVHQLSIGFNNYMPISITSDVYYEIACEDEQISEQQALEIGKEELSKRIEGSLSKSASVVSKTFEYELLENGSIKVKASYECIEDIAKEVEINHQ